MQPEALRLAAALLGICVAEHLRIPSLSQIVQDMVFKPESLTNRVSGASGCGANVKFLTLGLSRPPPPALVFMTVPEGQAPTGEYCTNDGFRGIVPSYLGTWTL